MQEIKFKYGYSDGTSLFEKVFTLSDIEQGLQFDEICDSPLMKDYKIVHRRQYTGLKDKNDVEIYGGDIIKGDVYLAYEVKWDFDNNGWNISSSNIQKYYKVIGNIYENPELLEDNYACTNKIL